MSAQEGEIIARRWLEDREITVALRRLQAHLDLVSEAARIYGVPGHACLDAEAWATLCRRDWSYLKSLRHEKLRMKNIGLRRIRFSVRESFTLIDGRILTTEKEILLEEEPDGVWRSVEENIRAHAILEPEEPAAAHAR